METLLCFGGALFIAAPLLVCIVRDIKPFISEIRSNRSSSTNARKQHHHHHEWFLMDKEKEDNDSANNAQQDNHNVDQTPKHQSEILDEVKLDQLQLQSNDVVDDVTAKSVASNSCQDLKQNQISWNSESIAILLQSSSILAWFGVLLCGYTLSRLTVEFADYRRNFKYIASHFQDAIDLCIRSFLVYVLGNICVRFQSKLHKLKFVIFVLYFLFVYLFTFEHCPNIQLEEEGLKNTNLVIVVVLLIMFVVIGLYVLVRNCYSSICNPSQWKQTRRLYWVLVLGVLLFNVLMIVCGSTHHVLVHIHHHYWSLLLALFCRTHGEVMFAVQAFLIAVMIHGIAVFGCSELYAWQNVNVQHFDEMCYDFQCQRYQCPLPKAQ